MCRKSVRPSRDFRLPLVALAFAAFTLAGTAAELPAQVKKAKQPESAQPVMKCNIGGIAGVVAANGVCVKLGGSISTEFNAGQIK
jgi:hypothetical protein